jgi:hypothetical protein
VHADAHIARTIEATPRNAASVSSPAPAAKREVAPRCGRAARCALSYDFR